jgi:formylglycine-generating enzyme required for sulfatase activity
MTEEITWIETYLLNKPDESNDAFKEESPLADVLKLQSVKTSNGLYGEMINNKLIPETVLIKKDSTSIGRFEVTNAQFKAYKSDFKYTSGLEDLPAVVTLENAKNYVKWLSEHTGKTYRLPNADEAKALHKSARKTASKENTLNYWAGYDLVPSDYEQLKEKLKTLQKTLLKEVGSTKASKIGDAEVYDIGGNVAEYYTEGIYGYSAYDYYDKNDDSQVQSNYVGIRIIKE